MARSTARTATTGAPKRPMRKDAARNRQRILDAAYELFAERGLSATLNDIAHYAGVGVGTVYRHFPDREQLIDGLFEQRIDEVLALLQEALEDPDPWRGLTGFLERNLAIQAQDRGLRELILGAAGGFKRLARARARLYPVGVQLIERARAAGALRDDIEPQDVPLLQLMLASVIDVTHEVAPELWRRYLALVLRGMRAEPGAPEPLPAEPPPVERLDQMMAAAWARKH
jgi:AcrR family transcriptional regulator